LEGVLSQGELSYDKDRYFAHGEAKLVAGHYVRMLELLAEGCATPVAKLNYLQVWNPASRLPKSVRNLCLPF
jgi:hypothetical protein